MFQSRCGFSGCLDKILRTQSDVVIQFQSRCGFSGCLDWAARRSPSTRSRVSIPLWVFWLSRRVFSGWLLNNERVSIPLWVFWLSRRSTACAVAKRTMFQSRCGFSGCLDDCLSITTHVLDWFQSRCGFSGCLDLLDQSAGKTLHDVSIPLWVFWLSRRSGESLISNQSSAFQSRCGFSGCLDFMSADQQQVNVDMFQSRCGFSGCLDIGHNFIAPETNEVSIPLWVFWLSRPLVEWS